MQTPVFIFYAYAQSSKQDEGLFVELAKHLALIERTHGIVGWHPGKIYAGQARLEEMDKYLNQAQIILLLLSVDFFSSPECTAIMERALVRCQQENTRVIPILLRPVSYLETSLTDLQILPRNCKAVIEWKNRDEVFVDIVGELKEVFQSIAPSSTTAQNKEPSASKYYTSVRGNIGVQNVGDNITTINSFPPKAQPSTASSTSQLHCDVLLVVATLIEARAVLDACEQATGQASEQHFIGNNTYFSLGVIGGARIFLVQTEMGTGGPGGALLTVSAGISVLSPSAVIMVGVAFGINSNKQHPGDILVARQIMSYESQRAGTNAVIPRGDRVQCSPRLLSRFRAGVIKWTGPSVEFGLVLSGEKLVDSLVFREQLQHLEPEAIGGEMEGAGLYAAAYQNKTDWILVKAICDWADGNKASDKEQRQREAAQNAAQFTVYVLRRGGFTTP
jgi:nucleoside phosphorylase